MLSGGPMSGYTEKIMYEKQSEQRAEIRGRTVTWFNPISSPGRQAFPASLTSCKKKNLIARQSRAATAGNQQYSQGQMPNWTLSPKQTM